MEYNHHHDGVIVLITTTAKKEAVRETDNRAVGSRCTQRGEYVCPDVAALPGVMEILYDRTDRWKEVPNTVETLNLCSEGS